MKEPHIEIKQKGIATEIFIDGQKIHGVRKVKFEYDQKNRAPILQIDILATDMEIDEVMVPALPEVLKPFYVERNCPAQ